MGKTKNKATEATVTDIEQQQIAEMEATPEVKATEDEEKKSNNAWINNLKYDKNDPQHSMIRDKEKDGKHFFSVSFEVGIGGDKSLEGIAELKNVAKGKKVMGSITVRDGQVKDATVFRNNERVPNPGFKSVLVGDKDKERTVSLNVTDKDGNYINIPMKNGDIAQRAKDAYSRYRASQKAAKGTQRDGVEVQGEAQAAEAQPEA